MIEKSNQFQTISDSYFQTITQLHFIEKPFFKNQAQNQIQRRDLQTQFQLLRAITETKKHQQKLRMNSTIQNKKNRYPEQSIYQHSRICLENKQNNQCFTSNYINANKITVPFPYHMIISQGPLESTQQDFESMLQQQNIQCVLMLCNVIQNGKIRCYDYTIDRQIQIIKENQKISIIKVYLPQSSFSYIHIHYTQWPDKTVPTSTSQLSHILQQISNYKRIVIHCSAGLGRSGVVAAALLIKLQYIQNKQFSVFKTARKLREERYGAIQNSEQYRYIYQWLTEV